MKVKSDEHRIILTDFPLSNWAIGLVVLSVGLQFLVYGILEASYSFLAALCGAVIVFAGLRVGSSAAYQKITINRWLKKITVRKIGLFDFGTVEISADDIENLYCEIEADSENFNSYTICLTLKTGRSLVLGTAFRSQAEVETVIKTARAFLEKPDFSGLPQPSFVEHSPG